MKKIKLKVFAEKVVEGYPVAYISDISRVIEKEIDLDKIITIKEFCPGQSVIYMKNGICRDSPETKEAIEQRIKEIVAKK